MMRLTRCAGWAAITVVAIAAIAVVGCGGGGDPEPPADTGSITGTILHAGTELPLGGIDVAAGGVTATTNANGQFTLSNVPAGTHVLTVTPPPDRDLALPPQEPIVVQVQKGQTTDLGLPILLIDGTEGVPDPPQ